MGITTTKFQKLVRLTAASLAASLACANVALAIDLRGAGATFPQPLYERYFQEYQDQKGIQVNYKGVGSGAGIKGFIRGTVDFAGSDAVPNSEEQSQMDRGLLMIPTAGGAVAIIYNLDGVIDMRLSRDVVGKIFTGQIKNWKQVDVRLPNQEIKVIVRQDSSGTTNIFTTFLSVVTKGKLQASKKPDWGFSVYGRGYGNGGVAARVKQTEGAIGYVQDSYAQKNNLDTAKVQNFSGDYAKPNLEEVKKALANVEFNEDFTIKNPGESPEGYPIVGITWLLLYQEYPNSEIADRVKDIIEWILTAGQDFNEELNYSRIPEDVAQKAIATVKSNVTVSDD